MEGGGTLIEAPERLKNILRVSVQSVPFTCAISVGWGVCLCPDCLWSNYPQDFFVQISNLCIWKIDKDNKNAFFFLFWWIDYLCWILRDLLCVYGLPFNACSARFFYMQYLLYPHLRWLWITSKYWNWIACKKFAFFSSQRKVPITHAEHIVQWMQFGFIITSRIPPVKIEKRSNTGNLRGQKFKQKLQPKSHSQIKSHSELNAAAILNA